MYSEEGTPIKIRASATQGGDKVQLEIIDQGYGIREKEVDRVFKPFQRARQPQIIREFGYGLSLYLAKTNIETMNGKIWFESEEGVGTTFFLLFPAYKDQEKKDTEE
jgi:signal transduction histidine kinase